MSKTYTTMSLDAIKFLCSHVKAIVDLPSTVISDTSIATNTTYSSYKIDLELDNLEDNVKAYTDTLIASLNKLTKEVIDDMSLVTNENVLYLYKAADDLSNNYMQIMLINGQPIQLGTTQADFTNIYNKTEVDNKFAAKVDLSTLTTSFNSLKTKLGDIDSLPKTVKEEIDDLKNASSMFDLTQAQYQELYANGFVVIDGETIKYDPETYYVINDDSSTLDGNSLNIKTYTKLEQLGLSNGCSVEDIFLALPNNSYLEIGTADNIDGYATVTNLPTTSKSTLLTIRKYTNARFDIQVKLSAGNEASANELYIGQLKGNDGTGLTWSKVCTTKVADTNGVGTLPDGIVGYVNYKVINGVAYISIDTLANGLTGTGIFDITNLPTPKMFTVSLLESGGNVVGSLYCVAGGSSFSVSKSSVEAGYISFSYPVLES